MKKFKEWLTIKEFRSVIPKYQPATKAPADVRDFRRLYGPTGSFIDTGDVQDITDVISQGLSGIFAGVGRLYRKNMEQMGILPAIPPTVISFHKSENQGNFIVVGKLELPPGRTPEDIAQRIEHILISKYGPDIEERGLDPNAKSQVYRYKDTTTGKEMIQLAMLFKPKDELRQHMPQGIIPNEEEGDE